VSLFRKNSQAALRSFVSGSQLLCAIGDLTKEHGDTDGKRSA
jgi:hypothetical protein